MWEENEREPAEMPGKPARNGSARASRNGGSELFDWAEALVSALTVLIIIFVFLIRLIGVDGHSMVPTLQDRDKLLVSNLFYEPTQGDIVVLTKKSFLETSIVKRVIATEGQWVDIDFDVGVVSVDGVALDESYVNEPTYLQEDVTFPVQVPEGCVFVMGDNRNNSSDSRRSVLGMVDKRYILGRVLLRILPLGAFGVVK